MLKVGDSAPDFDLPDAAMEMVSLADYCGKNFLINFAPSPTGQKQFMVVVSAGYIKDR